VQDLLGLSIGELVDDRLVRAGARIELVMPDMSFSRLRVEVSSAPGWPWTNTVGASS
jgi:hypothetical protein